MSMINYNNPIIISWNVDQDGKKVSVSVPNEQIRIINGKAVLNGLPDEQYRVTIESYVEKNIREKLINANEFKVDYLHGFIFFHESVGDIVLYANYYSRGVWQIPASKVWLNVDTNGNISQTLDDAFGELQSDIGQGVQVLEGVRIVKSHTPPSDSVFWLDTTVD